MLLTLAAMAALLMQVPEPGQNKGRGLLVGPAAERYEELVANEERLAIARLQIRALSAQSDYLRLLSSPEPLDNGRRIAAERALMDAVEALQKASTEYLAKHKHAPDCSIDLNQKVGCPAKAEK
jgi:hypothetical protein